jgi:hypothetical protein
MQNHFNSPLPAVQKYSKEFAEARQKYLKLFMESTESEMIRKGIFEFGEHAGKCLGLTTQKILNAKLPMPFGCPDLFIQPCEGGGVIWFCDRAGCICACCREDFTEENEKYPDYCPPKGGFDDYDEADDYEDEEDWRDDWEYEE